MQLPSKSTSTIFGSGGFGDALMVMNKFKTLGLHKTGAILQWYTDQQKTLNIIKELFELNGIKSNIEISQNLDNSIVPFKNSGNVFTTAWNGDISNDENALKYFISDNVSISDIFDIQGIKPSKQIEGPYYILQIEAGLVYHNKRKHWDNFILTMKFAQQINKKYGLKALVVGKNDSLPLLNDPSFIDISSTDFEIVEYLKGAKFFLGLSGFTALASLMLGKPTIMKQETEFINQRYYGHPGWKNRFHPIDEITDAKNIANIIYQLGKWYGYG